MIGSSLTFGSGCYMGSNLVSDIKVSNYRYVGNAQTNNGTKNFLENLFVEIETQKVKEEYWRKPGVGNFYGIINIEKKVEVKESKTEWKRADDVISELEKKLGENSTKSEREKATLHFTIGSIYTKAGMFDKAREQYEKAASLDRNFAYKAYVELGIACLDREWYDYSKKQFEMALEENPNEIAPHKYLAIIKEGEGMHEEAISELEKIIKKTPNDLDARFGIANIYEKQNLNDKALEQYKKITKIDSKNALAHYALGNIYKKKLMHEKAEEEWQRAIRIKPDFADAYNNLAVHYYEERDYGRALMTWKMVKELDSSYLDVNTNINLAMKKLTNNLTAKESEKTRAKAR